MPDFKPNSNCNLPNNPEEDLKKLDPEAYYSPEEYNKLPNSHFENKFPGKFFTEEKLDSEGKKVTVKYDLYNPKEECLENAESSLTYLTK